MVDAGVHHGQPQAARWLQMVVGVRQDGVVGPVTLEAVNAEDPVAVFLWIVACRIRRFGRLVSRDPELARARGAGFNLQATFSGGWNNRAAEFLEAAARRLEALHFASGGKA